MKRETRPRGRASFAPLQGRDHDSLPTGTDFGSVAEKGNGELCRSGRKLSMDDFTGYDWRGDDPPPGPVHILLVALTGAVAVIALVLVGVQLLGA